ncbi:hypothetical protein SAMD00019534_024210 [Acytostelium subglobosum LB1]|uniref:hypothetical protein n=1 Tax=Acytostelium subglobosum LB1 TaxID=1410327 RepID=UPI0006452311|nr:hypothetical protein SAMD00019534_024210 [Acytostelium subglobosum LB1]GAM19246.1 hypothetical protein SAMD00019534_024210 [Acytostelium subglobosum LB1]|eukprot:XP_012757173.1 hypothetical protein SAMD00019534_024210 [Acytostelium subglobosum LB1]
MDLYCQKCSKALELNESLLDIDHSVFLNKDCDQVLATVKELQERALKSNVQQQQQQHQQQYHQNPSMLQRTESLQTMMMGGPHSASMVSMPGTGSSIPLSSSFAATSGYLPNPSYSTNNMSTLSASYATSHLHQHDKATNQPLMKFKTGLFRKKSSHHAHVKHIEYQQQHPISNSNFQPQTTLSSSQQSMAAPTSAAALDNSSGSINNDTTANSSTSSLTDSTGSGVSMSTSPSSSSFGSLSKHRTKTMPTQPRLQKQHSTSSLNSESPSATTDMSKQFEGMDITQSGGGEPTKRAVSSSSTTKRQGNIRSSTNRSTLGMSSQGTPPTSPLSSSTRPNNFVSPQQQQKNSKLKYLRSNSKSFSLASLPNIQGDLAASAPMSVYNNNQMSPPPHGVSNYNSPQSPPNHLVPNGLQNSVSSTTSPIGSPPVAVTTGGAALGGVGNGAVPHNSIKYLQVITLFKTSTELIGYDLPLCFECAKLVLTEMDSDNSLAEREIKVYSDMLEGLNRQVSAQDEASVDREIEQLEETERFYFNNLDALRRERQHIATITDDLLQRQQQLATLENKYWSAYSEQQVDSYRLQDDRDSVLTQTTTTIDRLRRLKETNILNDAFHLWYDGHFGTINSLRLGRLQSQPVEWNEINSAWGLSISLLDNLAKRLNYKFKQYRLIPNGSTSKIEDITNKTVYELYGSSDISLGRLFWYGRFDNGMVSFLQCLKELCEHVKNAHDPTFEVPYTIENDHINGMLIKMQFTNEDTWTKSLKYMLTNLKWLLSWVAKNESTQPMEIHSTKRSNNASGNSSLSTTPSPHSNNNNNTPNGGSNATNNGGIITTTTTSTGSTPSKSSSSSSKSSHNK